VTCFIAHLLTISLFTYVYSLADRLLPCFLTYLFRNCSLFAYLLVVCLVTVSLLFVVILTCLIARLLTISLFTYVYSLADRLFLLPYLLISYLFVVCLPISSVLSYYFIAVCCDFDL